MQAVQVAIGIASILSRKPTDAMLDAMADRPGQVDQIRGALSEARMRADTEEKIRNGQLY